MTIKKPNTVYTPSPHDRNLIEQWNKRLNRPDAKYLHKYWAECIKKLKLEEVLTCLNGRFDFSFDLKNQQKHLTEEDKTAINKLQKCIEKKIELLDEKGTWAKVKRFIDNHWINHKLEWGFGGGFLLFSWIFMKMSPKDREEALRRMEKQAEKEAINQTFTQQQQRITDENTQNFYNNLNNSNAINNMDGSAYGVNYGM